MPRYFLNVRCSGVLIEDLEGEEAAGLGAIPTGIDFDVHRRPPRGPARPADEPMPVPPQRRVRNRLLAALPPPDHEAPPAVLEPVSLARGDVIVEPDQPLTHALFIEAGIVSAVSRAEGRRIEIGLAGREGFVGMPLALGVIRATAPGSTRPRATATALRRPSTSG